RIGNGEKLRAGIEFHAVEMLTYPLFEHPPYTLALASKICEVATSRQLDLVHMHYAIPHAVSAYLAREMLRKTRYLPVVTTLHGTDITLVGRDPSYLPITRFGIEQSDAVTAISNYLRDATQEAFCVGCGVEVIYNFVDSDYYCRTPNEEIRAELAPKGERIMLHVSTFRPIKRIGDCIEVLARMAATTAGAALPVRLVMCGDGPERRDAEALAARLGVADSALFVGKQPQSKIKDYLSVADLLLLPSQSESFGLSALEAMACEVPVIATRVGGIPEVVNDGESGYLFEIGDIEGMAGAAKRILDDERERKRLGSAGRAIAVERFASEKIIPQYEDLYRRTCERARHQSPAS
ncbi:MAG TPA: N-acetyl-alpha-D-glucosaminyl L-malate synthase BshA, partial [Blastocatellia bacterium]|nr:N-acetyl-alpha-D-glucosaminyl L-malate synthase BshA [Blastocatellia bacterium]